MMVRRYIHTAKPGKRKELVKLLKGWVEGTGVTGRVLVAGWADLDKVVCEVEWETEEVMHKFWADCDQSHPKIVEFHEGFDDLRESGTTREIWVTQ